ncbi:hypothetical protein KAZ66_00855 [Candidatus Woesebacteria bacterium]|nr:hypothetical protein [Candidatus Woesebacteria bacterium]
MKGLRENRVFIVIIILIISLFLVLDLLLHKGQPVTFDGPTHISNIAQMYAAMQDGEFPARWGGGFARYGLPIPVIAQQFTSYLGAFITYATHDVTVSYTIVVFIGAFVSTFAMYYFLRLYVSPYSALAGAYLFHFAPYRIMNVYIRGALPEFFSSTFILLILISMYYAIEKRLFSGYLMLALSVALLLLTHPFMFIVGSFLYIPYGLYLLRDKKFGEIKKISIFSICGVGLGFAIAAYFIVPLFIEIRYFYYGTTYSHFLPGHFLPLSNFIAERWYYFYKGDIFPRGHVHIGGIVEGIIALTAICISVGSYLKTKKIELIHIFAVAGVMIVFFTQEVTEPIYKAVIPLGNIQHPWRMMTGYVFIPPILFALLLHKIKRNDLYIVCLLSVIFLVSILRFPQLYGKNYVEHSQDTYFNTDYNLHGIVMDTVWMGDERTYPYQKKKIKIISGEGNISNEIIKNGSRSYTLEAKTPVRIVDYTFYFPGWKVWADGKPLTIQFQDPEYRGVITYEVPEGSHTIYAKFGETMVRMFGNIVSLLGLSMLVLLYYFRKKLHHFLIT